MAKAKEKRLGSSGIGGQSVMEGVMMRNGDHYAVAVREPDGTINVDVKEHKNFTNGHRILSLPFIRGIFNFIDSMVVGVSTLIYSAQFFEDEDDEEEEEKEQGRVEKWLSDKLGDRAEKVVMGFTVAVSVVFAVAIFMILPLFLADLIGRAVPFIGSAQVPVIEGILKLIIFIGYLLLISLMEEIQRTFMYHGAEHKCINCIESGLPLTVENVRKSSRFHKRCGTSFMFVIIIISIVIFILIRTKIIWLRYLIRLILIPIIAAISYEFIQKAGRSENVVINALSKPGLWMQRVTTKEPDDSMIEVGIKSVEAVFDWKAYLRDNGIDPDEKEEMPLPDQYKKVLKVSGYNWKF